LHVISCMSVRLFEDFKILLIEFVLCADDSKWITGC